MINGRRMTPLSGGKSGAAGRPPKPWPFPPRLLDYPSLPPLHRVPPPPPPAIKDLPPALF